MQKTAIEVVADKKMRKQCCDILGNKLENKNWLKFKKANGKEWIPSFLQYVDVEKCTGCGKCIEVCLGNCYQLKKVKGKLVSVAVYPEKCFGDCHCHKVCPIPSGAMVCKPKLI